MREDLMLADDATLEQVESWFDALSMDDIMEILLASDPRDYVEELLDPEEAETALLLLSADTRQQIVKAYGSFGTEIPDHADEFFDLDIDFLRKKAQKQLRDVKGKFRDMIARLTKKPVGGKVENADAVAPDLDRGSLNKDVDFPSVNPETVKAEEYKKDTRAGKRKAPIKFNEEGKETTIKQEVPEKPVVAKMSSEEVDKFEAAEIDDAMKSIYEHGIPLDSDPEAIAQIEAAVKKRLIERNEGLEEVEKLTPEEIESGSKLGGKFLPIDVGGNVDDAFNLMVPKVKVDEEGKETKEPGSHVRLNDLSLIQGTGPKTLVNKVWEEYEKLEDAAIKAEDQLIQKQGVIAKLTLQGGKENIRKAKEKAEEAEKLRKEFALNMCLASVPGTSLFCKETIDKERVVMPQAEGFTFDGSPAAKNFTKPGKAKADVKDALVGMFTDLGYTTEFRRVLSSSLTASQNELDTIDIARNIQTIKYRQKRSLDMLKDMAEKEKDEKRKQKLNDLIEKASNEPEFLDKIQAFSPWGLPPKLGKRPSKKKKEEAQKFEEGWKGQQENFNKWLDEATTLDTDMSSIIDDEFELMGTPALVDRAGYYIDGHHRWATDAVMNGNRTVVVQVMSTDIGENLDITTAFTKMMGVKPTAASEKDRAEIDSWNAEKQREYMEEGERQLIAIIKTKTNGEWTNDQIREYITFLKSGADPKKAPAFIKEIRDKAAKNRDKISRTFDETRRAADERRKKANAAMEAKRAAATTKKTVANKLNNRTVTAAAANTTIQNEVEEALFAYLDTLQDNDPIPDDLVREIDDYLNTTA